MWITVLPVVQTCNRNPKEKNVEKLCLVWQSNSPGLNRGCWHQLVGLFWEAAPGQQLIMNAASCSCCHVPEREKKTNPEPRAQTQALLEQPNRQEGESAWMLLPGAKHVNYPWANLNNILWELQCHPTSWYPPVPCAGGTAEVDFWWKLNLDAGNNLDRTGLPFVPDRCCKCVARKTAKVIQKTGNTEQE